jgi:hypothetical protein
LGSISPTITAHAVNVLKALLRDEMRQKVVFIDID